MTTAKIELHIHLEGSIRPGTLLEIARRNDAALPVTTVEDVARLYEYGDFSQFIDVWVLTTGGLRTGEDFRQIVVDYAQEAAGFGAVYVEAIFSPGQHVALQGCDWDELYTGCIEGAAEAGERFGVTMAVTPDVYLC